MKKFLLSFFISILFVSGLFAMPVFDSYIVDHSGEYVYYRDSTFTRESYIGILTYDESSFQIRYYAPANKDQKLEEKEISLLVTVDPAADHWEMTGERILTNSLLEESDVDIVNYLHDILYEFSARRGKMEMVDETEVFNREEYAQFGGQVKIKYNCIIPLFNIECIYSGDDIAVLQCVTIGNLRNMEDNSFENFKGISILINEKKNTAKIKKAKAVNYSFDNHTLQLDSKWTQSMENLWLYGDEAVISLATIPLYSDDAKMNRLYVLRKLLESADSSYIDYENARFNLSEQEKYVLSFRTFQQDPNNPKSNIIQNYKILTPNAAGGFDYFTLTAYVSAYNAKEKYFTKIIESYK